MCPKDAGHRKEGRMFLECLQFCHEDPGQLRDCRRRSENSYKRSKESPEKLALRHGSVFCDHKLLVLSYGDV